MEKIKHLILISNAFLIKVERFILRLLGILYIFI